jgi:hypothetical protein
MKTVNFSFLKHYCDRSVLEKAYRSLSFLTVRHHDRPNSYRDRNKLKQISLNLVNHNKYENRHSKSLDGHGK